MSSYANVVKLLNQTKTGQQQPRKGDENIMVKNNAGGYTYTVSDEEMITRILILGTNRNTYYSSATKLTDDAINYVKKVIADGNGQMIIDVLNDIYETNRAPKLDPLFFVLALLTQATVPVEIRVNALKLVSKLRTFSQLYSWKGLHKTISGGKKGFGRAVRKALFELFNNKTGKDLAYQTTKYNSRKVGDEKWSVVDIIKCSHIPSKNLSPETQIVISYLVKDLNSAIAKYEELKTENNNKLNEVLDYLKAVETVKSETCSTEDALFLINKYHLPREVLNTNLLNSLEVWYTLLFDFEKMRVIMPTTALIRNLGVMSSKGVFDDNKTVQLLVEHLTNQQVLTKSRIHPVALLLAKLTYDTGRGIKGKLTWKVNKSISEGLEKAFYLAFGNITGTGKRILHAVDCSGSMTMAMTSLPYMTSCQAVGTLVMEAVKREYKYSQENNTPYVQDVILFNHKGSYVEIRPEYNLNQVMKLIQDNTFGSTDCSQPMIKALQQYKRTGGREGSYDAFIVYTDNETYYGNVHPIDALLDYNRYTKNNARMVVIGTTATINTIGNNNYSNTKNMLYLDSPLCLNIAGFDLNAPTMIKNFLDGKLGSQQDTQDVNTDDYVLVDE
jgi:60 kDa SS-A/Ro ribonucleoprotein